MIGTRLAHYTVTAHLGSGGMGDVYQATDSNLGRNVAIKLLPEMFARDTERAARFEREARVLASLNHPNIASIYGLEESGGRKFLVMELVEGETLAQRINRGPIPIDEALGIAKQIAEAMEAAHEKAIIHRDLKPANVKITPDGKVKVLDFGLAKAMENAPADVSVSNSPTMSLAGTMQGVILGTAAYMSPEQAKGFNADPRSDVFSFGCVLYEVLTGKTAFEGDTVSEILASILKSEPDWSLLPRDLSPRLRELLRRCLEKSPRKRWYAAGDVRVELEAVGAAAPDAPMQAPPKGLTRWKIATGFAVLLLMAVGITAAVLWNVRPAKQAAITRFPIVVPEGQVFTGASRAVVAISPDGRNIVYVANQQLYLRGLSDIEAHPIPGTLGNPNAPFFSPDGRWIGFWAYEQKLKKIGLAGGTAVTICDAAAPFGVTWAPDDQIYVGQGPKGIGRVSATGGKIETIIEIQPGELAYGPQLMPDRDGVLFTLAVPATTGLGSTAWDSAKIVVQSLRSKERKELLAGGSDARYLSTGHLVYAIGRTVFGLALDPNKLEVRGDAVPLVESVARSKDWTTAATDFSVSMNGAMVYVPGFSIGSNMDLTLVDRSGVRKALNIESAAYSNPRFSPNGRQLTVHTEEGIVWVVDLNGAAPRRRLTFGGSSHRPLWTPDGQRIEFSSERDGKPGIFWQPADGRGTAELLTTLDRGLTPQSEFWTPDGKTLIFQVRSGGGSEGLFTLTPGTDQKAERLLPSPAGNASLSPDGRWIAHSASENGRTEVFVQPFPPTGAKYQVTTTGGTSALWAPDGKQLFYLEPQGRIVAVDVQTQPNFVLGKSTILPIRPPVNPGPRSYDISPDGKYFVVMYPKAQSDTTAADQINVTINWFEELHKRVPVN